jgi:hypothetical protein
MQKLLVVWLKPEVPRTNTTAPDWHLAKLVSEQREDASGRKVNWRALIDPAAVVHGCVAKIRPKYCMPNKEQADYFVRQMEMLQQNRSPTDIDVLQPENPENDPGDGSDDEMDDDIEQEV